MSTGIIFALLYVWLKPQLVPACLDCQTGQPLDSVPPPPRHVPPPPRASKQARLSRLVNTTCICNLSNTDALVLR